VTILDLDRELAIDPSAFHSRSRNTPFGGWKVVGGPWMTIVNGHVIAAVTEPGQ
jgi:dihydroorotase